MAANEKNHSSLGRAGSGGWALHDAKARFSEVVRRAREKGPQRIMFRGKDAVVIVKAEEFDRLSNLDRLQPDLHTFLSGSPLKDLDFEFESVHSPVREIEL